MKTTFPANLWVGTQPDPKDRLVLSVSAFDENKINKLPPGLTDAIVAVRDLNSGKVFVVKRAACGLGCCCALELAGEPTRFPEGAEL